PLNSTLFPYTTLFRSGLPELDLPGDPGFRAADVHHVLDVRHPRCGGCASPAVVQAVQHIDPTTRHGAVTGLVPSDEVALVHGGSDRKSTRLNSSHVAI